MSANGGASAIAGSTPRVHYFDWLRGAAVLGVVVYHVLLAFAARDWYIDNEEKSGLLAGGLLVFETFGLGLLFLLSGASARFALQRRSTRQFVLERASRLLLPFVVGTLLLTPPTMYLVAVHDGSTSESFLAFLVAWPTRAVDWARGIGFSPRLFGIGFHLWFLGFLFAFSVLGSPIFALLSSERGRALVNALARATRWRGATLLFALPITLPPLVLLAGPGEQQDWWQFGWYGATFLVGYLLYADERFVSAARRDFLPALVLGMVALGGLFLFDFAGWVAAHDEVLYAYDATYVLMVGLYGIGGWAWTLVLLNVGMRTPFMQRPLPGAAGEAVLPVYVLHHPVVLAVLFVVVGWPLGLVPKALIAVGLGLGASIVLAIVALRLAPVRTLLGVRHRLATAPVGASAT